MPIFALHSFRGLFSTLGDASVGMYDHVVVIDRPADIYPPKSCLHQSSYFIFMRSYDKDFENMYYRFIVFSSFFLVSSCRPNGSLFWVFVLRYDRFRGEIPASFAWVGVRFIMMMFQSTYSV